MCVGSSSDPAAGEKRVRRYGRSGGEDEGISRLIQRTDCFSNPTGVSCMYMLCVWILRDPISLSIYIMCMDPI